MRSERQKSFKLWDNVYGVIGVLIITGCILIIVLALQPKSDTEKAIEVELSLNK